MLAARKPKAPLLQIDDIFAGTSLRRSGSLVRGITVGSNQDLNVTSGLRLQLEGTLAPGVEIAAALTDENTPIQPEGNTQTLQEFDRVFVEVKAEKARATIGDFNLSLGGTEFANLERRLQGGKVEGTFNFSETSSISTLLSFANARGRFHTNQFNGRDGVQGPYRLTGPNGEPFIIVLAGTERVYVNGELMVRGQNNDYVIEYATGEIYFQPRRLITQQSRITVDFQFTERLYPRNFLTSKTVASLFDDRLRFQASFISESDDENSPIDFLLTERGRESLRQAGADRLRATDTTAFVGVDQVDRVAHTSKLTLSFKVSGGAFFALSAKAHLMHSGTRSSASCLKDKVRIDVSTLVSMSMLAKVWATMFPLRFYPFLQRKMF